MTKSYDLPNNAVVSLNSLVVVEGILEQHLEDHGILAHRAEIQEVIDAISALISEVDAIVLREEPSEIICSRCGDKTTDQASPDDSHCPECYSTLELNRIRAIENGGKSGPELEIEKLLVAGTWNITEATSRWLEIAPSDVVAYVRPQDIGGSPNQIHHGWIIHVFNEEEVDHSLPHDLWMLLSFARAQGCHKVHIDPDGPKIPGLTHFDW